MPRPEYLQNKYTQLLIVTNQQLCMRRKRSYKNVPKKRHSGKWIPPPKNSLDLGRQRVHQELAMQNKVFIGFISLILLTAVHNIMVDKDLYKKMTMKKLLLTLAKNPMWIIYAGIIAPNYEELYFRGVLQNKLGEKYSLAVTCVIIAVIWAMFHEAWYTFLYIVPMGIVLSLIYYKGKNIFFPIAIHV